MSVACFLAFIAEDAENGIATTVMVYTELNLVQCELNSSWSDLSSLLRYKVIRPELELI